MSNATRRRRRRRRLDGRSLWSTVRRAWMIHGGWRRAPGGSDDPARRAAVVVAVLTTGLFAVGVVRVGISLSRTAERSGTPEPLALPVIPLEFEGVSLETYLAAWVPDSQRDELLRSPVLRDPDFARRVHWWMRYWTGPASGWFPDFLARMAWLGGTVDSTLAVRDLPPSLRYLPLIESGYAPGVTSHASAVGLWQLMGPTARGLGLEVGPMVDERRSWERSTEAALTYLEDLREEFDSWFLALAAYNTGPTRVRRILRRHAPDAPRSDSLFWALRDQFAPETRDFMPKLYGAMWVASRPDAYGFELPSVEPLTFDTVSVPDRTPLDVVARAAGVPHDEILRLNPEFVQGITPGGGGVVVRLPRGRRGVFASAYARIPTSEEAGLVESATETTPQPQATPPS